MAWSHGLPKDAGPDGGEARKAVVTRWQENVLAREVTTLARKAGDAGRIEVSAREAESALTPAILT
jgi:hypothetical protein